ncbi:ABC transporter permease subunit [candidate division KSB3 bacterium]|uniref:ABC transporter permease subunit n=1 Tax=candidate division KSB3 bacterium TaxID=2044937 RepID=A0A9D5Q6H6_9BACT|nr:ABC transporter permease subunit [candidate division KSB3 bacterium]MBD3324931.1 ABC transporter permease subunit [candidate division KSB3 bacterium]
MKKLLIYGILTVMAIVWVFPLLSMLVTVIKSNDEFRELAFWGLPALSHIPGNLVSNFGDAWLKSDLGQNFFNSVIFALTAGIGSAFIASLAGYALVHLHVRVPQGWFFGIFIGNIFPFQMFLIPLYLFLNSLNLYDTRLGLAMVYIGICVPFALFVYRNYAFTLPRELFEAAKVDGASNWHSYLHIFLPLSKAAFAVVFIFQFIWTWNDLLFGLVLSESHRPVMTALSKLAGQRGGVPSTVLLSGAILASIPTVIILLSLQRYFVRGFTISTEK